MAPVPAFETPRLTLRPYELADIEPMAAMFADPEVTAFTLLGPRSHAQTEEVLDAYRGFLLDNGYGMYAILDRATGAYLGEVGTFHAPLDGEPVFLRYALARAAWNKGIATEASIPILDDAFDRLGLDEMGAGVVADNLASMRVMTKLGFTQGGTADARGHHFELFHLPRAQWRAHRPSLLAH